MGRSDAGTASGGQTIVSSRIAAQFLVDLSEPGCGTDASKCGQPDPVAGIETPGSVEKRNNEFFRLIRNMPRSAAATPYCRGGSPTPGFADPVQRNQRSDRISSTCLFSIESPRISLP